MPLTCAVGTTRTVTARCATLTKITHYFAASGAVMSLACVAEVIAPWKAPGSRRIADSSLPRPGYGCLDPRSGVVPMAEDTAMPLQDRVTPTGEIVADPSRGLMAGNPGFMPGHGRA